MASGKCHGSLREKVDRGRERKQERKKERKKERERLGKRGKVKEREQKREIHAERERENDFLPCLHHLLASSLTCFILFEIPLYFPSPVNRCVAKHSIPYLNLPSFFLAFDLYDSREQRFLSRRRFHRRLRGTGMAVVPVLALNQTFRSPCELLPFLERESRFRTDGGKVEGVYLRVDDDANEDDKSGRYHHHHHHPRNENDSDDKHDDSMAAGSREGMKRDRSSIGYSKRGGMMQGIRGRKSDGNSKGEMRDGEGKDRENAYLRTRCKLVRADFVAGILFILFISLSLSLCLSVLSLFSFFFPFILSLFHFSHCSTHIFLFYARLPHRSMLLSLSLSLVFSYSKGITGHWMRQKMVKNAVNLEFAQVRSGYGFLLLSFWLSSNSFCTDSTDFSFLSLLSLPFLLFFPSFPFFFFFHS